MSEEQVSTAARLNAERLMSGRRITDDEMRVIIAGLMLSVDELTHVVKGLTSKLWTDEQLRRSMREEVVTWSEESLRKIIGEEVSSHCAGRSRECAAQSEPKSATWVGRMLRSFAGIKCWAFGMCLLMALSGTGCASYGVRFDDSAQPTKRPYPATRVDCEAVSFLCTEFDLGFLIALPVMVDIPFSLVSDTVCLPYDMITLK